MKKGRRRKKPEEGLCEHSFNFLVVFCGFSVTRVFLAAHKRDVQGFSKQELDFIWESISGDLSAICQGRGPELPSDVRPFDPAADLTAQQQK